MRIRRWLINWLTRVDEPVKLGGYANPSTKRYDGGGASSFQFTVSIAKGGRVVEVQRFDRKREEFFQGLYVVTDDQDFGDEIDKILTMESLK